MERKRVTFCGSIFVPNWYSHSESQPIASPPNPNEARDMSQKLQQVQARQGKTSDAPNLIFSLPPLVLSYAAVWQEEKKLDQFVEEDDDEDDEDDPGSQGLSSEQNKATESSC